MLAAGAFAERLGGSGRLLAGHTSQVRWGGARTGFFEAQMITTVSRAPEHMGVIRACDVVAGADYRCLPVVQPHRGAGATA